MRPELGGFRQETARGVTRDVRAVERQLASTNREFSRFGRGALVGTGALRELGRAAAFASLSFIGGAGVVVGIKSTIKAAMDAEVVLGQTRNAVRRAGLSWEQYGDQIQEVSLAQAQLSGFDDERLLRTFSTFIRRTGDSTRALRLNALAANVARGRNIELEQAAQLVLKATLGQAGALRRLGIDAKVGASGLELVALLTEKYSGSVEEFANTAAGAQARFAVAIGETQEAIGTALLPSITDLLNKSTEWLNDTDNQERLQRTLASTVDVTTTAVTGLATAIGGVSDAITFLRNLPGGSTGLLDLPGGRTGVLEALGIGQGGDLRFGSAKEARAWAIAHRRSGGIEGELALKILATIPPDVTWGGPGSLFQATDAGTITQRKTGAVTGSLVGLFGSAPATRGDITATNLARAQAEGTKAQIVAAANARLEFIRDTIAFANKLIEQGRGDTKQLQATLQKFYGDEAATTAIITNIDDEAEAARKKRIQDAIDAGQKRARDAIDAYDRWRQARQEETDAIVKGAAKALDIKRLRAANAQARRDAREAIQDQILENNLLTAQLIPDEKKRLAAEKKAQMDIVQLARDRAKQLNASTLAGQIAIGEVRRAQLAFANLGKDTSSSTGGFTLAEFFAEAGDEFAMYGSNIGPRGAPLSRQDARASFDTSKTSMTNVVQVFNYPVGPSQALNDARASARNLK